MRAIPVTTRLKAAPKKVSTLNKTTDPDPKAKIYGSNPGKNTTKTITVSGTPGTDNLDKLNKGKKDLGPNFKPTQAQTDAANKEVANAKAKDIAAAKPIEKTVVVKGDPSNFEGTLMTTTKGTVLKPTEIRRLSRSSKKANRDVRRSEIKLSKYGTRQKDGTWKENPGLSARKSAKFRENQKELTNANNVASNVEKGAESGQGFGTSFVSGQRETQQSELSTDPVGEKAQENMLKKKDEAAKRANLFSKSNTGGQASKAVGIDNNATEDSGKTSFDYKRFTGEAGMRDAIRSANSPRPLGGENTVKKPSGFQMKGYGKK
tara:strand:- start:706 stop:1662 length:957 start_codon:yes stop_codon:yes gene_type:complete